MKNKKWIGYLILTAYLMFGIWFVGSAHAAEAPSCANIAKMAKAGDYDKVAVLAKICEDAQANETSTVKKVVADPAVASSVAPPAKKLSKEGNKYAETATAIGKAIGDAAKGVGVAANEFLRSPAGIILVSILAIKYVGGLLFGGLVLTMLLGGFWKFIQRMMTESIEYETVPMFWGAITVRRKKLIKISNKVTEDQAVMLLAVGFGCLILALIVGMNCF